MEQSTDHGAQLLSMEHLTGKIRFVSLSLLGLLSTHPLDELCYVASILERIRELSHVA